MEQRLEIAEWLKVLQDEICRGLENLDGGKEFREDKWERSGGGGGRTRVLEDGNVFEKGGVNFSAVFGAAPEFLAREFEHSPDEKIKSLSPQFFATGLSIVIHPSNPWVPIIHMNIRYFELTDGERMIGKWLGGGIDLTPHYFDAEESEIFHAGLKKMCDQHNTSYYEKFSRWADKYFYIPHRKETRGIGGIFFDRLDQDPEMSFDQNLSFWKSTGKLFLPLYSFIVRQKMNKGFGENEKNWQMLRRGRYIEFNLVYDKGTKFGLETGGRTESILMSLPKFASWTYDFKPALNSPEEKTLTFLQRNLD